MSFHQNEFKAWLIQDLKAKSYGNYSDIINIVTEFSKTDEFYNSLKKWIKVYKIKQSGPKHIGNIIENSFYK